VAPRSPLSEHQLAVLLKRSQQFLAGSSSDDTDRRVIEVARIGVTKWGDLRNINEAWLKYLGVGYSLSFQWIRGREYQRSVDGTRYVAV